MIDSIVGSSKPSVRTPTLTSTLVVPSLNLFKISDRRSLGVSPSITSVAICENAKDAAKSAGLTPRDLEKLKASFETHVARVRATQAKEREHAN